MTVRLGVYLAEMTTVQLELGGRPNRENNRTTRQSQNRGNNCGCQLYDSVVAKPWK